MRTSGVVGALLAAVAAVAAARQPTWVDQFPSVAKRQELLINALKEAGETRELDKLFKRLKIDSLQLGHEKALSPGQDVSIQREVERDLKPVPIVGGRLQHVLPQAPDAPFYTPWTAMQEDALSIVAKSVGRLEIKNGDDYVVAGTAFVTQDGHVATNCHVLRDFAAAQNGGWSIVGDVRVDFSESSSHLEEAEYRVTGIAAISDTRWLDVAVLETSAVSVAGASRLPSPLRVNATSVVSAGTSIAVIGYPDLETAGSGNFKEIRKNGKGRFAKIASPGAIVGAAERDGVDVLLHVAATLAGSSGSPILSTTSLEVIGVHNCCSGAGVVTAASPMACADVFVLPASRNQAIGSSTIAGSPPLKLLFTYPAAQALLAPR